MDRVGTIGVSRIDNSKLDYLKQLIKVYHRQLKKLPTIGYMLQKVDLTKDELRVYLKNLQDSNFLIKDQGVLRLNKEEIIDIKEDKEKLIDKDIDFSKKMIFKNYSVMEILRWVFLFIGLGAAYMSILYSFKWLVDFMDQFSAFLLSTIVVLFSIASAEMIIYFRQKGKKTLFILFIVLWSVVTIFSMLSTVAGQYNAKIHDLSKRFEQISEEENKIDSRHEFDTLRRSFLEAKEKLSLDCTRFQKMLSEFDTIEKINKEKKSYSSLNWQYNQCKKELSILDGKIESNFNKSKNERNSVKSIPPDFFVWLSKIFGLSPALTQFLMAIFPAIFIDLVAPISFGIFMFLKTEKVL